MNDTFFKDMLGFSFVFFTKNKKIVSVSLILSSYKITQFRKKNSDNFFSPFTWHIFWLFSVLFSQTTMRFLAGEKISSVILGLFKFLLRFRSVGIFWLKRYETSLDFDLLKFHFSGDLKNLFLRWKKLKQENQ